MDASAHAFAVAEGTPPDEMRQPVSVYALAKSLSMPYETTRRYVARLVEEGLCIKVVGGILVPGSVLSTPRMEILATRHYAHIMKFVGMVNQVSER
jgi:DeoR/GlpR family transcriptional regulator of sugar metabolism